MLAIILPLHLLKGYSLVGENLMLIYSQKRQGPNGAMFFRPKLAIWFGKQSIKSIQAVRSHMQSLEKGLQKSFLQKHQNKYQFLASLLIDAGRLAEAEQVLNMLKERELTETVRSSAMSSHLATVDDVGVEKVASERLARLQERGSKDAAELAALETRIKQGAELSAAEEARRQALIVSAEAWRVDFQRFIDGLDDLFKENTATLAQEAPPATNTRLQAKVALDPTGAVGLHYVVTEDHVSIIVATPKGSFGRRSNIKSADLNRQIGALRQAIVKKGDTREPAQALWQALIAPVWADVQAAGAQTQALRDFALRHVGVVLQQAQHPKVGVFLQLRAAAGHGEGFENATAVPCHSLTSTGGFRFVRIRTIVGS